MSLTCSVSCSYINLISMLSIVYFNMKAYFYDEYFQKQKKGKSSIVLHFVKLFHVFEFKVSCLSIFNLLQYIVLVNCWRKPGTMRFAVGKQRKLWLHWKVLELSWVVRPHFEKPWPSSIILVDIVKQWFSNCFIFFSVEESFVFSFNVWFLSFFGLSISVSTLESSVMSSHSCF